MEEKNNTNIGNNVVSQNQQNTGFESDISAFNFKDFLFLIINNWYWLLLSILVCTSVAMFIYKTKPKVYQESALVLLRVNSTRAEEVSSLLHNEGKMNRDVDNEMYIMRSARLMERVVMRLELQPSYKYVSLFKKYEYYHDTPIKISVFDKNNIMANDVTIDMEVLPISHDEYSYSISGGKSKKATFGETVKLDTEPSIWYRNTTTQCP